MRKIAPRYLLLGITFMLLTTSAFAQTDDWQTLSASGEEFTVSMPKDPLVETGTMPYHKLELNTRLYLSNPPNGPVYAIASFSGIKSNPAMYTEEQRLNSYVDAFKKFFIPRIKGKDAIGKMNIARSIKLSGHDGREYRLTVGDLEGPVHVFITRKRFYAISFLTNKKEDALKERFISSFTLPEKVIAPPTTASVTAPEVANPVEANKEKEAGSKGDDGQTDTSKGESKGESKEAANGSKQADGTQPTTDEKKPISGGLLNGKALSLPAPIYPPEARAANVTGAVNVQVTIDEYGNVVAANAASGHPLLQQAAVTAAYSARFSPTTLMGQPVRVVGIITYAFKQ
jgi:TonB family protein